MPRYLTLVSIFCLLIVAAVDGAPASRDRTVRRQKTRASEKEESPASTVQPVYPPLTRCGRQICDLRTQYCDKVIMSCASCVDDCHPMRIIGNLPATEECHEKCGWYYVFTSTPAATTSPASAVLALHEIDDWAFDGKKMFTFLVTCLFIAMIVILLLSGGFVASICIKCLTNRQPGSRHGVSMDTSSHCRSVDDSKLLTTNRLMPSLGTPDSCQNPSAVCMPASSEMTRPKTADTDVQRSNTTSLQTSASLQPLLTTRPDGSHQSP